MSYQDLDLTVTYNTSAAITDQKIKDQLRVMGYVQTLDLSIGEAEALIEDLQEWIKEKKQKEKYNGNND